MHLLLLCGLLAFSFASPLNQEITHGSAVIITLTYGQESPLTVRSDGVVALSSNSQGTSFRIYKDVPKPGGLILGHAFRVTTLDGRPCRVSDETGLVRCATDSVGKTLRILDKHGYDDGRALMSGDYVKFRVPGNGIDCQVKDGPFNCHKKEHWSYYGFIITLDDSVAVDSSYVPPTPGPAPRPAPIPAPRPASIPAPAPRPSSTTSPTSTVIPGPTPSTTPDAVSIGCYGITAKLATQKTTYSKRVITSNMSRRRCKESVCLDYPFSALTEGKACYCFTQAQVAKLGARPVPMAQCNVPCTATPNEKCGGPTNTIEIVKAGTQLAAAGQGSLVDATEDQPQTVGEPKEIDSISLTVNDNFVPGWAIALLVLGSLCAVALIVIVVVLVRGNIGQRV